MSGPPPFSPKILKGALIRLDTSGISITPQVIVFQYNPESVARKFKPYEPPANKEAAPSAPSLIAAPYNPEEEFDLTLELDATDALEEPDSHPTAVVFGIADRIAAMEMLLYPADGDPQLLAAVASTLNAAAGAAGIGGGAVQAMPKNRTTPIVLLVWGPGRVVPVKLTSLSVEEQAFNVALYPIRAKVSVGLKVLTDDFFAADSFHKELTTAEKMAQAAYRYTLHQKQALAAANIANGIESVLAMLPF